MAKKTNGHFGGEWPVGHSLPTSSNGRGHSLTTSANGRGHSLTSSVNGQLVYDQDFMNFDEFSSDDERYWDSAKQIPKIGHIFLNIY